jgi:hypothetical protein
MYRRFCRKGSGKAVRLMVRLCLLLIVSPPLRFLSAQDQKVNPAVPAEKYLSERGEVIFRFAIAPWMNMDNLTRRFSIDNIRNDSVTAYANREEFEYFLSLKVPFRVLQPPSPGNKPAPILKQASVDWRNHYPSYPEYIQLMEDFASDYPDICRLSEYGASVKGRKLMVLKITDQPDMAEHEPVVFLSSSFHGDEPLGYILLLRLIDDLLNSYTSDTSVQDLLDHAEVWINPLSNPDGTYYSSDSSVEGSVRYNANRKDLNRDFPEPNDDFWETRSRQPETMAMMNFMKSKHIALAANFHGGAEVVNYPWDTWQRLHADDQWYRGISRAYADTVHANSPTGYMTDLDNGITNGYAWYPVFGGRQDYSNYFLHAREVTVELSGNKIPPEETIEDFWNFNRKSMLRYMCEVFTGFTGVISDSVTGQPLESEIMIPNHDKDHSSVISSSTDGIFYRLMVPGNYQVQVKAHMHSNKMLNIQVTPGGMTQMDVRLELLNLKGLYPNPFSNMIYFITSKPGNNLLLEITDLSGRKVKQVNYPVMYAGEQAIQVHDLSPGVYIVNFTYDHETGRQVMVKTVK